MKEEKLKVLQEKTRGVFHILEYRRFWDYITNLQEENERLKEIIKDNTILVKDENGNYQECNINLLDYKSRIDKAIPIIDKLLENSADNQLVAELEEMEYFIWIDSQYEKLLNILQGEDK